LNKKLFWIYALSSSVYFVQGIESLPSQSLFYYLKESLYFSPSKIMVLGSIISSAWLLKPLIGYVVDNFFTKRSLIFFALLMSLATVMVVGLVALPVFMLVFVLLLNSTNAAFRDVCVDGVMCVEGKAYNITGKIQSVQWISISISGLLTGILGGIIAEKWGFRIGFLSLIPFYLLVGLAAFYFKEDLVRDPGRNRLPIIASLKPVLTNKKILVVGLFIFLYRFSPSFGTPLFFIQRDSFGWGKVWIGALSTISTIFEIMGAVLYYKFSQRINVKKWLYWSVFLGGAVTLSYLYYTPVTAVIYNIFYGFIGMFIFLMVMDFMARNSLKGYEATSFALLCSFSNVALTASNLSGAFLLPLIGLKWLIVISSLASFSCLLLIKKI